MTLFIQIKLILMFYAYLNLIYSILTALDVPMMVSSKNKKHILLAKNMQKVKVFQTA